MSGSLFHSIIAYRVEEESNTVRISGTGKKPLNDDIVLCTSGTPFSLFLSKKDILLFLSKMSALSGRRAFLGVAAILLVGALSVSAGVIRATEKTHHDVVEKKKHLLDPEKIEHRQLHSHHQKHLDSELLDHMTEEEMLKDFRKVDLNHDHYVSREEWLSALDLGALGGNDDPASSEKATGKLGQLPENDMHKAEFFDSKDRNKDGRVSFNEYQIWIHENWEAHKEQYYDDLHKHDEL